MFPLKDDIPTRRFPYLTVAFIVANVAMFFLFQGHFLESAGEVEQNVDRLRSDPLRAHPPGRGV